MSLPFEDYKPMTDNPFIDILLYNLKILSFNSIIKDQYQADNNETKESLKDSGIFIACVENHAELGLFEIIPHEFLVEVGMTNEQIELYEKDFDQYFIPKKYHEPLIKLLQPWYIENYEELNPYYRMITGMPTVGDPGIPMRDYEYLIPEDIPYDGTYLHEVGVDICRMLEVNGVLDVIKADYPDEKYLDYLTPGINIYEARKKLDFQILYHPEANLSVTQQFLYKYSENRKFIIGTAYSSAMEIESPYYHKFMMIFLIITTIMDMLVEVQSHIVKKDILDRRCIEYIFSMYGIPYYRTIPYKYQERMCKNVYSLIKYKSSTTEMLNLIKLFGFEDINIFKYYLLKVRKLNPWGEFEYESNEQLVCSENDIIVHEQLVESMSTPSNPLPIPPNLDWYPEEIRPAQYSIVDNSSNLKNINDSESVKTSVLSALDASNDINIISEEENAQYVMTKASVRSTYVERYIAYPFDYFLQKGNVMFVKLDGYILKEGIDYQILNYNKIRFLNNIASGKRTLTYEFYYDKDTINKSFNVDVEHAVQTITKQFKSNGNVRTFDLNPIPWTNYFTNGNQLIVSVSSVWLSPDMYKIDFDNYTVTISEEVELKNRDIWVIFIYSKSLKTKFEKHNVIITEDSQDRIQIPEPFTHYTINENTFFVTIGSTFIDRDRYQIYASGRDNNSFIKFTDGTRVLRGRSVTFNFLYSTNAIVNRLNILETTIHIVADKFYQYEFDIDFPIPHYAECRYKAFVKLLGWWLPEEFYTIIGNKLVFVDQSIALQPGDEMDVVLVYADKDRTEYKYSNIKVATDFRVANKDKQSVFTIAYPVQHYFTKENVLIVDVEGVLLKENKDYTIDYDAKTVTLLTKDYKPMTGQRVNYTFIYNMDAEYVISLDAKQVPIERTDQDEFSIDFPFFPYLETGQEFLVLIGSTLISKDRITMTSKFTLKIDGLELTKIGRYITILFIYNNYYTLNASPKLIVEWKECGVIGGQDHIDIPTPFEEYIENNWDCFVSYGNRIFLNEDKYDVFNHTFYTYPSTDLLNNKYGKTITFTFIYLIREPWVFKDTSEAYERTTDLVFSKVPINDLYSTQYLKDASNYKSYDAMTTADGWWDGLEYKDNAHSIIKTAIYKQKFNYVRSKYYSIAQVVDLAEYSAQMSYFYSMLYDDVFLEENLNISIPSLSPSHKFNIAHLFVYMTSLTYIFNGMEDFVLDQPSKVLFVQGFNFRASLTKLKEYLRVCHRDPDDFPIWDMIIPTSQIKDLTEFMNIFKTDMKVRKTIIKLMMKSQDHDEYKVWKKLYDSLMVWKLNLKYFKLKDGTLAETYTDFLREKDMILYTSLQQIDTIPDYETKQDTIVNMIDNIVYVLDEYIDSEEFKYIYDRFPGVSGEYAMNYIFMMIDFFKSYKIVFFTKAVQMNVGESGEDPDSSMKGYDVAYMHSTTSGIEYFPLVEVVNTVEHMELYERNGKHENGTWMREDFSIIEKHV